MRTATTARHEELTPAAPSGRQALDGIVWTLLANGMAVPTGLATTMILTRRLGPNGYGLFILAATVVAWVEWTLVSFFGRATIKAVSEAEDWRHAGVAVLRATLIIGGGMAVVLWILAGPLSVMLNEPVLATYLRVFALDVPIFCLAQAQRSILMGVGRFRQQSAATVSRWIARMLLITLLVEVGFSVPGAIVGSIGASLVELGVGRFNARLSPFRRSPFALQQLWDYAVPLFLTALSLRLYSRLDLFVLKLFGATAAQAGIYSAAQDISLAPSIFALSLSPVLLATLSRALRAGHTQQAERMSRDAMRGVLGLLPFACMTAGASSEIVNLVFGPQFAPAGPLLAVMIFAGLSLLMISVGTAILTASGKPEWTLLPTGPLVPLAVAGYLLLIPRLGPLGACVATTVSSLLGAVVAVAAVNRMCGIRLPVSTVGRSVVIGALAYALAAGWTSPGFLLLLKLAVITLAIGAGFLLLRELSASEIALARAMLGRSAVPRRTPREI